MRTLNGLLLTFLLNSLWQAALVACAALLCARILRRAAARYQHALWVCALILSFALPALTAFFLARGDFAPTPAPVAVFAPLSAAGAAQVAAHAAPVPTGASVNLSGWTGACVLALYLLFVSGRALKLLRAWVRTLSIRDSVRAVEQPEPLLSILRRSQRALGVAGARVVRSEKIPVPVTVGVLRPLVILPDALLYEADPDVLASAIGHELAHVARRDYFFNLVYELLFLPLSFHPAAALARRRIVETRELVCDELVAERLLDREVYARSLVQMAGSAVPLGSRAGTVSVGINDADILEMRIMTLLRRTSQKVRGGRVWLILAAALLAVPCVAAASFATRFTVEWADTGAGPQEPSARQEPSAEEKAKREARELDEREMKERAERDPQYRAELEARERRGREEREVKDRMQAELARLAKISMDQAIQTATAQHPGKVLECSLVGERFKEPGELSKDARVFYHVVVLSGDEANPVRYHVLVNAVDGTLIKTEAEKRREEPEKEKL